MFFYVDGSVSTPQAVYKDSAGNTAWTLPIVLDSGGNLPNGGEVWFQAGLVYKVVFAPSNDTSPPTSPYRTLPSLSGMNDITAAVSDFVVGPQPTFVSASQFTLVGDQTGTFTKSRRLKFTVTAGQVYGTISSVSFGALTTVNVAFTSGALDAGLSTVSYSLIDPSKPSINADYINKQASTVASAGNGTTNIYGIDGNYVHVTGTNTIASFSTASYAGVERDIIFDSALTLIHGGNLLVPGAVNVTTAANDRAKVRADTTTSHVITFYQRASGMPLVSGPNMQPKVFTATSTDTVPSWARHAKVYAKAAGASGGGSTAGTSRGGGGGEGEERWGWFSVIPGQTITATINAGGVAIGANINATGNSGGTTVVTNGTFTVTCAGGIGGSSGTVGGAVGAGGSGGSGGDYAMAGDPGQSGSDAGAGIAINAAGGGKGAGTTGQAATANCGGGGVGGTNAVGSGAGATGIAVVEYWP